MSYFLKNGDLYKKNSDGLIAFLIDPKTPEREFLTLGDVWYYLKMRDRNAKWILDKEYGPD